jgi:NADPH:quinone reductase-like Zn-dependent oxidoreductase
VTSYRCVVATRRGGPEVLQVVERELRDPQPDEVRVRVQAASVSLVDVQARQGRGPFQQKASFVPGYTVVGQVDALGDDVAGFAPGDRVAVLTEINGYAEYVYVRRNPILRISDSFDAAAAVTLVLNYLVAYQVLHRRSRVQAGDRVLIVGAGGGIGTALCELGQLAGLVMYGVDSAAKHHALARYGVIPIDLQTDDLAAAVRRAEPNGLDAVFDGVGGDYVDTALSVLRPGGVLVEYANPLSKRGLLRLLARKAALRLTGGRRRLRLYGTNTWRYDRRPLLRDWRALFTLLAEDRISPVVARTFPLNQAGAANALLESGTVIGNLVLLPEHAGGLRATETLTTSSN